MFKPTINSLPRLQLIAILVLINIAVFIAIDDIWQVSSAGETILSERMVAHQKIVTGEALAPYRYRILVPYTVDLLIQRVRTIMPFKDAFLISYGLFFFVANTFVLLSLFIYSTLWLSDKLAFIGCLYAAITMSAGFRYFHPYSFLEVGLFTTALYLIYHQKDIALFVVVLIASLTRETAIFIVLVYALVRRDLRGTVSLALVWLVIFLGLRLWLGRADSTETIEQIWRHNVSLRGLYVMFLNGFLFYGPLWIFGLRNLKHSPLFLKQTAVVGLLYLMAIAVFGRWEEPRLLMLLYPIVLPIALANFSETKTT